MLHRLHDFEEPSLTPSSAALQGLERFGAGGTRDIVEALLPDWHEQTVRSRAARLLGVPKT